MELLTINSNKLSLPLAVAVAVRRGCPLDLPNIISGRIGGVTRPIWEPRQLSVPIARFRNFGVENQRDGLRYNVPPTFDDAMVRPR